MIIKCNAEWLQQNADKNAEAEYNDNYKYNPWTGDGSKHIPRSPEDGDDDTGPYDDDDEDDTSVLPDDIEPSQFAHFDLRYIELLGEARDFAQYLLQEWDERWRNVLCEYYDYAGGKNSPRLIEESEANLHQLRKRMRDRVNELVDNNVCSFEVFDVMVKRYLKNICQKTPVLATYKRVEKNTRSED